MPPASITMALPPNWRIAISKDTRVRVEFFSKIIASTCPASGASASTRPLGQLRAPACARGHRPESPQGLRPRIHQIQEMPDAITPPPGR
jgi:hypothetical protein